MSNIFQGRRVRLRAVETADWEIWYNAEPNTDDGRLAYEIPFPASAEQVRANVENLAKSGAPGDEFRFMIERLDGEYVGTLNTHTLNPRCGTFMYGIGIIPQYRQQGFASEAVRLVLRYYFWERRYQKVNAEVYSFNAASMRLHERLGFTLEGRLRRMIFTGGQYYDALIYGQTREEFEASGWDGLREGY
ncbi:MAG TPA: GNAT family protein [Phototrophicaceae bacterium]|nr:GNAT family protein [Phototrophicaceae bacterium]